LGGNIVSTSNETHQQDHDDDDDDDKVALAILVLLFVNGESSPFYAIVHGFKCIFS
jgi:hypothetical protein